MSLGAFLQETMGDARLTAETLGHCGVASVSGDTKITEHVRDSRDRSYPLGPWIWVSAGSLAGRLQQDRQCQDKQGE